MILSHDIKTLPIDLETFDFVEREYANEKLVRNKCGRDFLYYSLHYYFPDKFNRNKNNPILIDEDKIFGFPVNDTFSWLLIQFFKVPALFKKLGLSLSINDKQIKNFASFVFSIINPNKKSAENAITEVENNVDSGFSVGIDVSMGFFGLADHVIFVYGYDKNNLYVFDTHQAPGLEYKKITEDNRYFMKLPKEIIKKRWTRFGRVWIITKK